MAARRLIVVMLVLLFVSSLVAALAPVREPERDSPPSTTPEAPPARPGRLVEATLDARSPRPGVVDRLAVGDQLQLRVEGRAVATVEIPALGATESVGPLAPAHFDLLLRRAGSYRVRILETGRRIGTLEVARARPKRTPERAGPRA